MQILTALMWFFCVFVLPLKAQPAKLSNGKDEEQIPFGFFFLLVSGQIINQFVATFYGVHSTRFDLQLICRIWASFRMRDMQKAAFPAVAFWLFSCLVAWLPSCCQFAWLSACLAASSSAPSSLSSSAAQSSLATAEKEQQIKEL